ncbi:hypothetical protein [Citricoccus nitrophenolicus]|uniref:hypothetical protein n=1 Tax=Citricoccus nitrophenolicus TaxID=863575 RepID=UPI0031F009A5
MSKASDAFAYALQHCASDLGPEASVSVSRSLDALLSLEQSIDQQTARQAITEAPQGELTAFPKER